MNQNIWGPHLWFSLHTITFNYPIKPTEDDKLNYNNFFLSLKNVIPCSVCKKNYIRHLNEMPLDKALNSRKDLVYWLIDLHNMVNGETGKKIIPPDIVIKKYEDVYNKKIILDDLNNKDNIQNNNNNDIINNKYYKNNINNKNNNIRIIINYLFIFFLLLLLFTFLYKFIINKKDK
jgi:hypothetical protein